MTRFAVGILCFTIVCACSCSDRFGNSAKGSADERLCRSIESYILEVEKAARLSDPKKRFDAMFEALEKFERFLVSSPGLNSAQADTIRQDADEFRACLSYVSPGAMSGNFVDKALQAKARLMAVCGSEGSKGE